MDVWAIPNSDVNDMTSFQGTLQTFCFSLFYAPVLLKTSFRYLKNCAKVDINPTGQNSRGKKPQIFSRGNRISEHSKSHCSFSLSRYLCDMHAQQFIYCFSITLLSDKSKIISDEIFRYVIIVLTLERTALLIVYI